MGHVISFLNQKGGVGKTSSVFHLAGTFSRSGCRVLLVDNDPQASLTQGFLGPAAAEAIDPGASVAALYEPGACPVPEAVVIPTGLPGVDIVPGSIALTLHNTPDPVGWPDRQGGIRSFLEDAGADYELVLIDNPPNLHLCSWSALVASGWIVVPLQAEDFGSQGLAPVQRSINAVRSAVNPGLSLAGYLLTIFNKRLGVHGAYEAMLRGQYGDQVFANAIPDAKDFKEAVALRKPVAQSKPRSKAARAVEAVAAELMTRVEAGADLQRGRGAA
jgi:chromosome partitioning protein